VVKWKEVSLIKFSQICFQIQLTLSLDLAQLVPNPEVGVAENIELEEEQILEIIEVDIFTQCVMKRFDVPAMKEPGEANNKRNYETEESFHLFF
jgi:hypothetical protein